MRQIQLKEDKAMLAHKPPMGWNSWNTFADKINEMLIMDTADTIIAVSYTHLVTIDMNIL